jgi:hypothetical protein
MNVVFLLFQGSATRLTSACVQYRGQRAYGYGITRSFTKDSETACASGALLLYRNGDPDAYRSHGGIPSFNPSTLWAPRTKSRLLSRFMGSCFLHGSSSFYFRAALLLPAVRRSIAVWESPQLSCWCLWFRLRLPRQSPWCGAASISAAT